MKKISKSEVEKKLNRAVAHAVPDVKSSIIERCKETNVKYAPMPSSKKNRRYQRAIISRILVAAAAILLLVNLGVYGLKGTKNNQIYTIIDIDVNPSIELKINNDDRVVEVVAVNSDALEIIADMDLTGSKTNVAVNALLGSMLSHGYLSDDTRTILVSVNSNDKENAERVQEYIAKDIGNMLNTYSVEATVVSQTMVVDDKQVATIADEYGISTGKAELVQKIVVADGTYNPEELSDMSVTELNTILGEVGADDNLYEVKTTGNSEDELVIIDTTKNTLGDEAQISGNTNDETDSSDKTSGNGDSSVETTQNKPSSDDSKDSTSKNSVSKNSVSKNSVSDNSVSKNSVSTNSVSKNSVSKNSVSSNGIAANTSTSVSKNSVSKNSVSSNSVSKNSISMNDIIKQIKKSN